MKKSNRKGFTIVELVIVIAVIAILAAILIPTFTSIIKKANMSVDLQMVRQMNTILSTTEIIDGKPTYVVEVQDILIENGIDDFTPMASTNVFYWAGSDDRVLLWNTEENKVTFPEDLAKKYADVTEPSSDWADLSVVYDENNYIKIVPDAGQNLGEALVEAIRSADSGTILQLPENGEADIGDKAYYITSYLQSSDGTGKHITIDLNGGKLISDTEYIRNGDDDGYYSITVPENGTLELLNGEVNITTNGVVNNALGAETGAKLVLRKIKLVTNGAGIYPSGATGEIVIDNCDITVANYAVGSNRQESGYIRITINNSNLVATDASAILISANFNTHIYDSTITGVVHGIIVRMGYVELKDSTVITTGIEPSEYSYKNFASGYNFGGYWQGGNTIPGSVLAIGDYAEADSEDSFPYAGDVTVKMTNVELQSADPFEIPEILLAASDPAKNVTVSYDSASSVGNVVVYGSVWESHEAVTFNHPGKITVNGVKKNLG